jgi:hypothetical protein
MISGAFHRPVQSGVAGAFLRRNDDGENAANPTLVTVPHGLLNAADEVIE